MAGGSALLGRALHQNYIAHRRLIFASSGAPGRWSQGSTRDLRLSPGRQQHCPCHLAPSALPYACQGYSSTQQTQPIGNTQTKLSDDSTCSQGDSLSRLQAFLGYQFSNPALLQQACTHSSDKAELSYRQLAFLGDAALWLLFAEHAFNHFGHYEDPISGAWPTLMSDILSRANCAATARQWGLQHYLQHSQQQQQQQQQYSASSSSSSSSSGRANRSGMYQGNWTSDPLAEMFEGVIGALLLDSSYVTVRQLLQPWVTEEFAAARAAAAAMHEPMLQDTAASSSSTANNIGQAAVTLKFEAVLQQQLQATCGYSFRDRQILHTCSQHISLLLVHGSSSPDQEKWHFLGYSLLRYAAAQHVYCCQQQQQQQQQHSGLRHHADDSDVKHYNNSGARHTGSSCSDNVSWIEDQLEATGHSSSGSDDDSTSNSSSSSSSSSNTCSSRNVVQLMSKQMVDLTTVRHRCKMWLWLGLDPRPWFPPTSHIFTVKWKIQKQMISRCLDLLIAAVYLDQGLDAALVFVRVLLSGTPPTGMDKSWIPSWAIKGAAAAAAAANRDPRCVSSGC